MGIKNLLEKYKDDPIMLDAIYQWATNPTSKSAVRKGRYPDYSLIKENLKIRYDLEDQEAEEVYKKFKEELSSEGISLWRDFPYLIETVEKFIENEDNALRKEFFKKLKTASELEKRIIWVYYKFPDIPCKATFKSIFNINIEKSDIEETLLKFGFYNISEWVYSTETPRRELVRIETSYSQPVRENVEKYIKVQLPEFPDYRKFIDALYNKKSLKILTQLQELLVNGYLLYDPSESEKLIPYPYIIGFSNNDFIKYEYEYGNCYLVLNPLLREPIRKYLVEKKEKEIEQVPNFLNKLLSHLSEKYFPELYFEEEKTFEGAKVWNVYYTKGDIRIICAPWLTRGEEIKLIDEKIACILIKGFYPKLSIHTTGRTEKVKDLCKEIIDNFEKKIVSLEAENSEKTENLENSEKNVNLVEDNIEDLQVEKEFTANSEKSEEKEPATQFSSEDKSLASKKLQIYLGKSSNEEDIFWKPGELNNGHLIIVGGSGAGKTETIRCIASELHKQGFPVLMIDFHGDMKPSNCTVNTYTINESGEYYFNPLELSEKFKEITPLRALSDFIDSIRINFPTIGIQQRERLKNIIKNAYKELGITNDPRTWNKELSFKKIEKEINLSEDSVTQSIKAYLEDIFDYNLFAGREKISIEQILKPGITHFNLKPLPEQLRSLYADLLLRKVYYSLQALGEIPRGNIDDKQKFRLFVIVDEAKLLVSENQGVKAVLNKYATELRKFGVGMILASQLINHFNDEILANVALKLCMKAENMKQARINSKFFGIKEESLIKLKQGEGILIMEDRKVKVRIIPTWER